MTELRKQFFKYVTPATARAILTNGKLRWSAPHKFNDPFDIQFDMHVEFDEPKLVRDVVDELWLAYSRKKDFEARNQLGYFVKEMSIKTQNIARGDFERTVRSGVIGSLAAQRSALPKLHAWARDQLKTALVLCLSEAPSNILMWAHYADCHRGAVLRFDTLEASSWAVARPVVYREKMPLLFDHDEMLKFLTGRTTIDRDSFRLDSVLTKSLDWRYEREWRVIWYGKKALDYEDTAFDPRELSGIYLGCRVSQADADDLSKLAKKLNPKVEVFKGRKSEKAFTVEFERSR